jgi:hypothetical protein
LRKTHGNLHNIPSSNFKGNSRPDLSFAWAIPKEEPWIIQRTVNRCHHLPEIHIAPSYHQMAKAWFDRSQERYVITIQRGGYFACPSLPFVPVSKLFKIWALKLFHFVLRLNFSFLPCQTHRHFSFFIESFPSNWEDSWSSNHFTSLADAKGIFSAEVHPHSDYGVEATRPFRLSCYSGCCFSST